MDAARSVLRKPMGSDISSSSSTFELGGDGGAGVPVVAGNVLLLIYRTYDRNGPRYVSVLVCVRTVLSTGRVVGVHAVLDPWEYTSHLLDIDGRTCIREGLERLSATKLSTFHMIYTLPTPAVEGAAYIRTVTALGEDDRRVDLLAFLVADGTDQDACVRSLVNTVWASLYLEVCRNAEDRESSVILAQPASEDRSDIYETVLLREATRLVCDLRPLGSYTTPAPATGRGSALARVHRPRGRRGSLVFMVRGARARLRQVRNVGSRIVLGRGSVLPVIAE